MKNWIEWLKGKPFVLAIGVALIAVLLGFLMARHIPCGWLITLFIGAIGALVIRKIVVDKLKDISKDKEIEIQP